MDILLLIIGLGLILAGANFLTDGSAALAQRFRVPEFIIGLTVVAVGTSTPELVVSVLSAIAGKSDVAIGNVVGSNIFNVFVILGVCALIRPLPLTAGNIRRDIPFGVIVSLLLLALAADSYVFKGAADRIGRIDGIVMLLLYGALMWYTIRTTKRPEATAPDAGAKPGMAGWLMAAMIVGGLAGLIFGGEMFLRSATEIARRLGISESVIAITLVAGGTSLPELASSLVSLFKGKADMALGNVIGHRQHPADPGLERDDPSALDGRHHGLGPADGRIEFGAAVPRGLHVQTPGDRPLGGRDLPGDLRRLHRVSDTIIRPQPHGSLLNPAEAGFKTRSRPNRPASGNGRRAAARHSRPASRPGRP